MRRKRPEHLLIETKLNRPAIAVKWVLRPRLTSRLDEGLKRRITLISAPAGFGKTSLAVQWLNRKPGLSAWLSLDKNDSDPERFLRYVLAALRTAVPALCAGVDRLLSAVQLPPTDYLADAMISDLSALEEPVVLVLDDFQTLSSGEVQKILARTVEHMPENLHLVILSRVDPPWPLANWRVRQWLNELRAADLSFTEAETRTLFRTYNLTDETVKMLQKRTEGWVAGLQLVQLSLAEASDPERFVRNFSGSDRLIVDYLMDEVVSRQLPDVLDFLSATALLERFCAPLADFMLADASRKQQSHRLIALLEKENLFLVPLDSERIWYRYHHLFQNLLTHHLEIRMAPERKALLCRRAAEWFAREGLIEDAIRHYLAGGDVDAAAGLVEENLHAIIDDDVSRRTLARWLAMFPPQAELQRPVLLVAHSYVAMTQWNLARASQLLDQLEVTLHDPAIVLAEKSRQDLLGDFHSQRAFCLYWQGEAERALPHALAARQCVSREHHYTYTLAGLFAAGSYAAIGQRDKALCFLDEAIAEDRGMGSKNVGQLLVARAAIDYYAGNLDGVVDDADDMFKVHAIVGVPDYWLGYAYYFKGNVAYFRNELETAALHLQRVAEMVFLVSTRLYHDSLIGLALIARARGEMIKVAELTAQARAFAMERKDPYSLEVSDSFDNQKASLAVPPTTVDCSKFWLAIPSLAYAERLIHQKAPDNCREILEYIEVAIQKAKKYHNFRQVLEFLTVKALALEKAGEQDAALQVLEQALRVAEPQRIVRTFLDRGQLMADLLKTYLERNSDAAYAHQLLAAFDQEESRQNGAAASPAESPHANMPANTVLPEALTNREIDVLLLLEQRLSNKEIAEKLRVSAETVKTHTIRIFRKLGVNGRRQAVAAAGQLGLLPSK